MKLITTFSLALLLFQCLPAWSQKTIELEYTDNLFKEANGFNVLADGIVTYHTEIDRENKKTKVIYEFYDTTMHLVATKNTSHADDLICFLHTNIEDKLCFFWHSYDKKKYIDYKLEIMDLKTQKVKSLTGKMPKGFYPYLLWSNNNELFALDTNENNYVQLRLDQETLVVQPFEKDKITFLSENYLSHTGSLLFSTKKDDNSWGFRKVYINAETSPLYLDIASANGSSLIDIAFENDSPSVKTMCFGTYAEGLSKKERDRWNFEKSLNNSFLDPHFLPVKGFYLAGVSANHQQFIHFYPYTPIQVDPELNNKKTEIKVQTASPYGVYSIGNIYVAIAAVKKTRYKYDHWLTADKTVSEYLLFIGFNSVGDELWRDSIDFERPGEQYISSITKAKDGPGYILNVYNGEENDLTKISETGLSDYKGKIEHDFDRESSWENGAFTYKIKWYGKYSVSVTEVMGAKRKITLEKVK